MKTYRNYAKLKFIGLNHIINSTSKTLLIKPVNYDNNLLNKTNNQSYAD
jgi:hypothetical protein